MSPSNWPRRAWNWLKQWFRPQYRQHDRIPQQPQEEHKGPDLDDQSDRYEVKDQGGQVVDQTGSLGRALKSWKDLTDQAGTITDTTTGEDLTPEPDDNGRYAVFDEQGNQVGTFDQRSAAFQAWEAETDKKGSVIDTLRKEDITPFTSYLDDEELEEALSIVRMAGGRGWSHEFDEDYSNQLDVDEVLRLIPLVNRRRLKIFSLGNAQGQGFNVPTKTVKVTKRRSVVERAPRDEWRNVPLRPVPTDWDRTVQPDDDFETRRIENLGELTRVNPALLVNPTFDRDLAERELPIRQYVDETAGEVPTKRMKFTVMDERIVPEEWEEEVQVTDELRIQLLYALVDYSGSMSGGNAELAAAIAIVLITKHLNDDSKYFFSWFANLVDKRQKGSTRKQKEQLIAFILRGEAEESIGFGTSIITAIREGARTIRRSNRRDDIPELLIITDGQDDVSAVDIFDAIGTEVVLHVIVLNNSNWSLERHAGTYEEVSDHQLQ